MKTQYVVQTQSKTRWAWETYFKTREEAIACRDRMKKSKCYVRVEAWKETFAKPGSLITRSVI